MSLLVAICIVVAVVVLLHIIAWMVYVPKALQVIAQVPWMHCEKAAPSEHPREDVVLDLRGGRRLHGSYLHTRRINRVGVVLFCHELLGDRWNALPYVERLLETGYDVFTFDFGQHGESEGPEGYMPMPWTTDYEIADVRAAIDYLADRADADRRGVLVWGVSRGGTAALCALGDDARVRAMVLDGLVPTEEIQLHYTRRFMGIYLERTAWIWNNAPNIWLDAFGFWTRVALSRRVGSRLASIRRAASRTSVPVLLVHGQRDSYVPAPLVDRVRRRMRSENRMWVVPKAKHNGAIVKAHDEYLQRVTRFYEKHLGETTPVLATAKVELQPE